VQPAFNIPVALWVCHSGAQPTFEQHRVYKCSDDSSALRMLFSGKSHYDALLLGELQSAEMMAIDMTPDCEFTADTGSSDDSSSSSAKSSSGKRNGSKKNNNKQQQQQQQQRKSSSSKSKKKGKK
jgi:hypothetical protein